MKTTNLERRFKEFIRGIRKGSGHSTANLLSYLFWQSPSFRKKYINNKIVFYYLQTEIKELGKIECGNIIWYIKKYGEPPVLNSSIPNRYKDLKWNDPL